MSQCSSVPSAWPRRRIVLTGAALVALSAAACGVARAGDDVRARDLAASCGACHGTDGRAAAGFASLAGVDQADIVAKLLAFRSGARPATVMHQHARGYTPAEIELIAGYFARQRPVETGQ